MCQFEKRMNNQSKGVNLGVMREGLFPMAKWEVAHWKIGTSLLQKVLIGLYIYLNDPIKVVFKN